MYQQEGVPLLILAGKEYGSGSSRDWAAKGVLLLGVRAVIAESFERIHRTNLVGMGVLPLQFQAGQNAAGLGLPARRATTSRVSPRRSTAADASPLCAPLQTNGDRDEVPGRLVRVDTPQEVEYYRNGGILPYVLRQLAK